ncbi:uncharacterized protein AB675_11552 [Cyphellophora attinorum]|uniref:Clr5 domain-containing protein n=1 Tax=Cyphellophora attinorum TaxID=1664694 RepID=A0A0N0NMF8_9EURO|nr:uncharacterized protein AB675_11552 [Phialophora attinorum]KPI40149.1 hypothetical protein AB675_11552 [Phialophora attinorum]
MTSLVVAASGSHIVAAAIPGRRRIPEEEWDHHKSTIVAKYTVQGEKLENVRAQMLDEGFDASPKEYKSKLKEWGISKNAVKWEWLVMHRILLEQKDSGIANPRVWFHEIARNFSNTRRHLRSLGLTPKQFDQQARQCAIPTPAWIRPYGISTSATPSALSFQQSHPNIELSSNSSDEVCRDTPSGLTEHQLYTMHSELACLAAATRDTAARDHHIRKATAALAGMCKTRYHLVFVAVASVLTLLLLYADGPLPDMILTASLAVSQTMTDENGQLSTVLEWMVELVRANNSPTVMATCHIGIETLRQAVLHTGTAFGHTHPHTLVIRYCAAFHLILTTKVYEEAERLLLDLWNDCTLVLGEADLLTVNVLAAVSRAQQRQGKYVQALITLDRCLGVLPFGHLHPHPHWLELLVRKAVIFWKMGRYADAELIYWEVVRGRSTTLGRWHRATIAAHNSLADVLQKTGHWEARKDEYHRLLSDPPEFVGTPKSWWRDSFEASRLMSDGLIDEEED